MVLELGYSERVPRTLHNSPFTPLQSPILEGSKQWKLGDTPNPGSILLHREGNGRIHSRGS